MQQETSKTKSATNTFLMIYISIYNLVNLRFRKSLKYVGLSVCMFVHSSSQFWSNDSQFFSYKNVLAQNTARPNFDKNR